MFQGAQEVQKSAIASHPWSAQQYMDALKDTPNLMELVRNPYILSFILQLLPIITTPTQDVSRTEVSLDVLFRHIFMKLVEAGKRRLASKDMDLQELSVFGNLLDYGFGGACMEYQRELSFKIFKKQRGDPVVRYWHLRDKDRTPWKNKFFGPDLESVLLQESAPLVRSGHYYRFFHWSLLQYLFSLEVFDPDDAGESDSGNDGPGGSILERSREGANGLASALEQANALEKDHKLGVANIAKCSMAVQFLADRVQNSPVFKERLVKTVRESANNPSNNSTDQTLAANAMTILVRSGMRFNSADLRGIKIRGANLTGGEFDSADLRDADLRNTTLDRCCLRGARLEGALLTRAKFGELPSVLLSGTPVTSAYSSDGKYYSVSFTSGCITVFNTSEWEVDYSFQGSKKSIGAMSFSPNSKILAYGDMIGIVRTRQHPMDTTTAPASFQAHNDFISDLVFSPDGLKIATASVDNKIGLWDAASGRCHWSKIKRHGGVSSVSFSPDSKLLVSGGSDKIIRLWDVETGQLAYTLEGHEGAISKVLFSPNGNQIASASSDNTARVWSVTTRTCEHTFAGHSDRVTSIAFSPDGQRFTSCSEDRTIRMWDPRSGSAGPIFRGHTDHVIGVAYSTDGKQFTSCGRDKRLCRWVCRGNIKGAIIFGRTNTASSGMYPHSTIKRSNNIDNDKLFQPTHQRPQTLLSQSGRLKGHGTVFAISPDGTRTATRCANPLNVQLWRNNVTLFKDDQVYLPFLKYTNEPSPDHQLIGHPKKISCIAFSPDNQHIASGSFDGSVRIWDTRLGENICTITGNAGEVTSLAFCPRGLQIVTGSADGTIRLWDELGTIRLWDELGTIRLWDELKGVTSTGRCLATFKVEKNNQSMLSVAISPSGQWVASGGEDGVVRVWYANSSDKHSVTLEGHQRSVNSIVFSPDNKHIASGSDDNTVKIWNIDTRKEVRSLLHDGAIKCLAYLSSGRQLVSGGNNCKIWDVETGDLQSIFRHAQGVVTIVSSLDGVQLFTGTGDRKFYDWRSAIAGQYTALVSTTAFSGDSRLIASSL
ncbi:hypothetical protein BGZ95_006049, partial [Linnemannia exigua]